jgi:hypothetical protein
MSKRIMWGFLTIVLGVLFLFDLAIPDPLPLVDEIGAGVLTVLSGVKTLQEFWKTARKRVKPEDKPAETE